MLLLVKNFNRILLPVCAVLLSTLTARAQPFSLRKAVDIDTLRILVQLPEFELGSGLDSKLNQQILHFNSRPEKEFFLVRDSVAYGSWLALKMSPVKYVNTKRNITGLLLNAGIIGGHIFLITSIGWTFLPLVPLFPHTISITQVEINPDLITDKRNFRRIGIGSIGMFNTMERQTEKFKKAFGKQILKTAYQIEKQDRKNRKRSARNL